MLCIDEPVILFQRHNPPYPLFLGSQETLRFRICLMVIEQNEEIGYFDILYHLFMTCCNATPLVGVVDLM